MNLQLSNPFAALEHKKAKKKKEKSEREKRKKDKKDTLELEKAIFDQPQINVSSWADCDSDDDWAAEAEAQAAAPDTNGAHVEEADSDHEIIDLEEEFGVELGGDDHHDHDHADEKETEAEKADVPAPLPKRKSAPAPVERQLSKKELKKKEMDELDKVLAELGIESGGKEEESEGKSSKKKKRKAKAGEALLPKTNGEPGVPDKEAECDPPEAADKDKQPTPDPQPAELESTIWTSQEEESAIDGEVAFDTLKAKMSLKKKPSKKAGSASSLAAAEAKARAKKKGSKKDKSKFNQAPTRN